MVSIMEFDELVLKGQSLFEEHDAMEAHSNYNYWVKNVSKWLAHEFDGTGLSAEWAGLGHSSLVISNNYHDYPAAWESFHKLVNLRLKWLGLTLSKFNQKSENKEVTKTKTNLSKSNNVFIVHGHDESVRETVARFIQKVGFEPVILHEQANSGRTIIEKFESNSDVCFSIVLLTGDDAGGLKDDPIESYKLRARQNVIFELGFFIGKIGRSKVCALYQEGVEMPSDYSGIVFIKLDAAGAWKLQLAREMKDSGLAVDMNNAI